MKLPTFLTHLWKRKSRGGPRVLNAQSSPDATALRTDSSRSAPPHKHPLGLAGKIAAAWINSPLTPLFIVTSALLGLGALFLLPREEEPQIKVPMVDVMVAMPGASAKEVAERVTRPMEQLLWEIPDAEYVYSTSTPGQSMAIVRFKVGSDVEAALVRLNQKLQSNADRIPPGVSPPLIKARSIDDVPILALTLHSAKLDGVQLRQVAAQLREEVQKIPQVSETKLIGGQSRELRVTLDPVTLASRGLSGHEVMAALTAANQSTQGASLTADNHEIRLRTGDFLKDADDLRAVVIAVKNGRPIYLRDIGTVAETIADPTHMVLYTGPSGDFEQAVTITLAKRPGANAIGVVEKVLARVESFKQNSMPSSVEVAVTRDYGHTAAEKSDELLLHMGLAILGVSLLILFFLGWRESLVVAIAIPVTLALTLLVFYLIGYTLNRITLFALIFSIGILVDDAIVVVENIVRHQHLPGNAKRTLSEVAIAAVSEVGNPTILATLAVIAAILPMAFVGGLMGPYMRPIPVGSTAAMIFSILVAFMVTPWAAVRLLRKTPHGAHSTHGTGAASGAGPDDFFTRLYHRVMEPLLAKRKWRVVFLGSIVALLLGALALVPLGAVKVKMLPFDNKSEFQVILNMPEGASLEETTAVAKELAMRVRQEPEVRDAQVYAGTASPYNFNGLVRHYFMRRAANQADVQVNLVGKSERSRQSHAIAKSLRPDLAAIAARHNARLAVAEVPPGPPVLQTLVAEVYGPTAQSRRKLAEKIMSLMRETEGVMDLDRYWEDPAPQAHLIIDREKAALHGISQADIARTVEMAASGVAVGLLHSDRAREDVPISLRLPKDWRTRPEDLLALRLRSSSGALIPLRELVHIKNETVDAAIYRKNLQDVVYVTADMGGTSESPGYAIVELMGKVSKLNAQDYGGATATVAQYHLNQPVSGDEAAVKWDGEWHITLEVFRDLGLAFMVVCVLIYALMVGWFKDFLTPLIVMAAIPFSLIGIMPAHAMAGAFFTATSMIGFMAGAGIVVRNSIILVDFIQLRRGEGLPLAQAVVEAGAVRFRPMLLTALAVVVGASVILADPIFQGLALSLLAGEIASLLISRMAVPVLYFMANEAGEKKAETIKAHENDPVAE